MLALSYLSSSTTNPNSMQTERSEVRARVTPAAIGLGLAVLLRLAWPLQAMPTHVDEGGWPFSVRQWATTGAMTYDFHTAPAFHVVLGTLYRIAPPTILTARLFSAVLSLVALWLLWWTARRLLQDDRAAAWAALLWATCFPASDLAARAMIEPQQLVWLLSLLAALVSTGPMVVVAVAATTAGLLLTKANALVILPALAVGALWDGSPFATAQRARKLAGMAAGAAVAAFVYFGLYLYDPAAFSLGWGLTMQKPDVLSDAAVLRVGRFVIDPGLVERLIEFLGSQTPFLLAFGLAGTVYGLLRRQALGVALWSAMLLPFLLIQLFYSPHYFAILYPAFAVLAAGLLAKAQQTETGRLRWPALVVGLIAIDGLGRTAVATATLRAAERPAIEWLHTNARDGAALGAPYLLMQLPNPGVSLFAYEAQGFLPDSASLRDVRWVLMDAREWGPRLRIDASDSAAVSSLLGPCCSLVYRDRALSVYRVIAP